MPIRCQNGVEMDAKTHPKSIQKQVTGNIRKIIGKTFIEVFDKAAKKISNVDYLGQGTLYPDIIESIPFFGGPTAKIKSHHNVGGLPKKMKLKIVEPLKELFKDDDLVDVVKGPQNGVWKEPGDGSKNHSAALTQGMRETDKEYICFFCKELIFCCTLN